MRKLTEPQKTDQLDLRTRLEMGYKTAEGSRILAVRIRQEMNAPEGPDGLWRSGPGSVTVGQ